MSVIISNWLLGLSAYFQSCATEQRSVTKYKLFIETFWSGI